MDINIKRKQLLIRAWRRGMRDLDLLTGPWAQAKLQVMSEEELQEFEKILLYPDPQILAMLLGQIDFDPALSADMLNDIIAFKQQ